jgi:signal peptidase I
MKKALKQYLPTIVVTLVISLFVRTYIAEAMRVPTESMVPTIHINDHVVVEKVMRMTKLEHGDIVVFVPPVENKRYVKRLIGLPGDVIEIKNGSLYRNDELVIEPYINEEMNYSYGPVTVPDDQYFFLGDNRNISYDSHLWAEPFIKEEDIIGKVLLEIPTHLFIR